MKATAIAHSNIALVKYWGKRDAALNLPAAGSVSLTLEGLDTTTSVEFGVGADEVWLGGDHASAGDARRVLEFLDLVWPERPYACVKSVNDFPTSAGLASSASGFAALALAASAAAGQSLSEKALSVLARRGSGSAARSIVDGFAWLHVGDRTDGTDCYAESIAGPEHWDLRCLVAVTRRGAKKVGSTVGMNRTMQTSPYYEAWVASVAPAINEARAAIATRDFDALAAVAEASCLQMHASAIAAVPGVLYWTGATVDLIHEVRRWRDGGQSVFFTIDAGPHVKVFCPASVADQVQRQLEARDDVLDVLTAKPGRGARLVEA